LPNNHECRRKVTWIAQGRGTKEATENLKNNKKW
jgi:hypothetical protein